MSFHATRGPLHNWGPGPRFDNATISTYQVAQSSYSYTHTVGGRDNRILLVAVHLLVAGTVTNITYNSVGMTFVRADSNGVYRTEVWRLFAPAQGSNSVAVTLSGSLTSFSSAVSMWHSHQTSLDADNGANGINGPATGSVTTIKDDCRVLGFLTTSDTSVDPTTTSEQQYVLATGALGTAAAAGDLGVIYPPGASTLDWGSIGLTDTWLVSLVSVRPPVIVFVAPTLFVRDHVGRGMVVPFAR
jgi:hypothetical protein